MGMYSKTIIAAIMGVITVCNTIWPGSIGLDEGTVTIIVGALTPVLVFLIPNKKIS